MKKTLLGLALISACLCACNSKTSQVENSEPKSDSYVTPKDWYTPRYYDSDVEPREYSSFMEFDYKKEKDRADLFEYLETVEEGKYIEDFPVPLSSTTENEVGRFYTSSYYNCCEKEFKRQSLNFEFEIDHPWYNYGMKTDYYGGEIFHLCVMADWTNEAVLDKYYYMYTSEEISEERFQQIKSSSDWRFSGHWIGNFTPDDEYKECTKFEIVEVFSLCTRMFFSYDIDRNLDKVRIYEGTPSSGSRIKIIGLNK